MRRQEAAPKVAFALGGLAGSNAHGVGFLHAAARLGVEPDMISCTSGMIYWAWLWITKQDICGKIREAAAATPFKEPFLPLNWVPMTLFGVEGVMRPAYAEFWQNLVRLPPPMSAGDLLDRLAPARRSVPTRPKCQFDRIAADLNEYKKPIIFNSFDPQNGEEYLHANPEGMKMRARIEEKRERTLGARTAGEQDRLAFSLPQVKWEEITSDAVRDALWLTSYGFDPPETGKPRRIDGAYIRQFILNELSEAGVIFAARPQSFRYPGDLPRNAFEVQDLQTEFWFNGPYAQQVARMDWVNRMVRKGGLLAPDFHEITLVPVEIDVPRGFFNYFIEDLGVFDRAVVQSLAALRAHWPPDVGSAGKDAKGGGKGIHLQPRIEVHGDRTKPALWFVHGFGETSHCFSDLLGTELARQYRLIAFDFPGFGRSPADPTCRTVPDMAGLLAALIETHCPGETVGIVAHSLGSPIAVLAARCLGPRVAGLFSIEGNLLKADTNLTGTVAAKRDAATAHRDFLEEIDRLIRTSVGSAQALVRYRAAVEKADQETLFSMARSIIDMGDQPFEDYRALRQPSFFYWGEESTARKTRDRISLHDITGQSYPGDGHWPMIDRPDDTADAILEFFRRHLPGTPNAVAVAAETG